MRRSILLMNDWLFKYKNNDFINVNLPHTWNNIDGQDGGNDYYRGSCIYERKVSKPIFDLLKEDVYLVFEGVNASATIVFNNHEVIKHDGGYSTFRVNVTEFLKDENDLKIIVDNSVNDRVYPQNADFTFYGGIYRDVYFLVINKTRFDIDYYGGPGIKYYSTVNGNDATVFVETFSNSDNVFIELYDQENNLVLQQKGTKVSFLVKDAHLWNGLIDPYLYKIVAKIICDDEVLDEISCNCGIRTFKVDPKKGFFLNGKSYPLHGVSRHQDRKALGNAISYEMMDEDMNLIKEIGANTIRLAHYQHNQYFYDLCDKVGMVVWAEIPYISEHLVNGRENTINQMKELIIQNFNHPSIVTWGLSNEITIKDNHRKDMLDNHYVLQKLCKELDPTRVTTLACFAMCTPFHPVTKISDIIGWNLYLGWYVPFKWLNDCFMTFYHTFWPKRALSYSEYGAEGMPNLHSKHPKRGDHTEEYQAIYHEYMLRCFKRHPYLWGTYIWNMFDFAADARNQGGEPGMNHKGMITFDRLTKKDSFYLYKAWWSTEPVLHICSKRYEKREGKKAIIKVYSNQKEVSLYNNGKLIKTISADKVFKFKIKLEDVNNIVAKSGNLEDNATFIKVNERCPEYKLKATDSKNWM